jgi:hypothetical protein
LEQLRANLPPQPDAGHIIPAGERIAATRQKMKALGTLGIASETVASVKDFDLPGPAGPIPVRLYTPRWEDLFHHLCRPSRITTVEDLSQGI